MPLGQRPGDRSDSRYCGVEADFDDDVAQVLASNTSGGFDFVVSPLIVASNRSSLSSRDGSGASAPPFAASDLILSPAQWSSHVVGIFCSWIDLDSEDVIVTSDSEITLKQEVAWTSLLSLQACLLPSPKGASCANYSLH